MKCAWILCGLMVVFLAGCGKPPAEEYMKKASDAEKAGLWSVALEEYDRLIRDHPESEYAETAYFSRAAIYNNHLMDFPLAIERYKEYLSKYPGGRKAPAATFLIAFLYNNEVKNIDSAAVYYRLFIDRFPDDEMAPSAQFELQNLGRSPDEILGAASPGAPQALRKTAPAATKQK